MRRAAMHGAGAGSDCPLSAAGVIFGGIMEKKLITVDLIVAILAVFCVGLTLTLGLSIRGCCSSRPGSWH